MMLMNCTHCDDLVVLLDDRERTCLCGRSKGRLVGKSKTSGLPPIVSGPVRLAELPWEEYDMASAGNWQRWRLLKASRKG